MVVERDVEDRMKNIIFIAPPAAGKGTQSELLVNNYKYNHISTGDLLRNKQNDGSKLGNELKELLKSGKLVDDEIVTNLLKEKLVSIDGPFILDGYPRNRKQALELDKIFNELNINNYVGIYLDVDEDTALKRALGRITCPKCKRTYNKYNQETKPLNEGLCDDCNIELIGRSDDNEETFKIRFNEYLNNTKPLLDYYKEKDLLYVMENKIDPKELFNDIKEVIL